ELDRHRERVEFGPAIAAHADVLVHLDGDLLLQVLIEIRREEIEHLLAAHHDLAPMALREFGSLKWEASRFRTFRRARWSRDFTAATERSRMSATSEFESSSTSRRTNTCRNSGGTASIASRLPVWGSLLRRCLTGP